MEKVVAAVKKTSDKVILPRFKALNAADIEEKSGPGDLVTIADIEAEEELSKALKQLVDSSVVVGEESTAKNPDIINLLSGESPVWVIDPIDGTKNFTKGSNLFCTMVCLMKRNSPVLALIFDPFKDKYIAAEKGGGAWLHNIKKKSSEKLKVVEPTTLENMMGYLSLGGFRDRETRDKMRLLAGDIFKNYDNLGCSGHEYINLVTGEKHFAINYRTYPWDHLPGCLIHSEAGGYQTRFDGNNCSSLELTAGLIVAPNKAACHEIRENFLLSYL
ncbi:MAG: inositol-1-monophosphatase [Rhodospirillaceae bacterium]|nr:inositol-1-monophosphatase [Rhodospirillaceae bacterium]